MKKQQFIVDARHPDRIVRISSDKQQYLINQGKQERWEDKQFLEINYPELVQDYNYFLITGQRYSNEFIEQKQTQFALFQLYENQELERKQRPKRKQIESKQKMKDIQTVQYSKYQNGQQLDENILKGSNIIIIMNATDGDIRTTESVNTLIRITKQLYELGYHQEELQLRFRKIILKDEDNNNKNKQQQCEISKNINMCKMKAIE